MATECGHCSYAAICLTVGFKELVRRVRMLRCRGCRQVWVDARTREQARVIRIGWRYQTNYKCRRVEVPCLGNNKDHLYLLDVVIDSCPACRPGVEEVPKRTASRSPNMSWYVVAGTVRFEEVGANNAKV